ncbi:MAG: ribosomal protein S18-alanine N-acetyltransferase [Nocardioidaceae bacterium]
MTEIRPAAAADVDAVADLELRVFGAAAWSHDSVSGEFEGLGRTRFIVVATEETEQGPALVGYASMMYVAGLADVQRIAVDLEHRRKGLGSRLLDIVLDAAVSHRCHKVLLEVAADNAPALRLYARRGFAEIGRRRRYYAGQVDAVVMELQPDTA